MKKPAKQNKRRYLISLYHTRSVLALDASILHIFYGIYRLDAARTGRKRRKQSA